MPCNLFSDYRFHKFEHYDDLPDTRREGDFHVGHGMRVAWFKDPDGNILSLVGR